MSKICTACCSPYIQSVPVGPVDSQEQVVSFQDCASTELPASTHEVLLCVPLLTPVLMIAGDDQTDTNRSEICRGLQITGRFALVSLKSKSIDVGACAILP